MVIAGVIFAILLLLVSMCLGYLYILALAGIPRRRVSIPDQPIHTFAIAIPAHNEESVIGTTVDNLLQMDYPHDMYDIHVVSDNSTDNTASIVRDRGVYCWERFHDTLRSKGYALAWLFERLLGHERAYDAIVVFDADSCVDCSFLRVMDALLAEGHQVVQGRHIIANPDQGWPAAVRYVALAMDNRLRNLGRSNLGFSSKLMGDAMCFTRDVLETYPWQAASLTEDTEYQSMLLLNGIRVIFAPEAVSYGQAATDLGVAGRQRTRWMHGRMGVARNWAKQLLYSGLRHWDLAQIDGAIERLMPSYSTLLIITLLSTVGWCVLNSLLTWHFGLWLLGVWFALGLYPTLSLIMERIPPRVYLHLAYAPIYVLWRSILSVGVRLRPGRQDWVRTPHVDQHQQGETVRRSLDTGD